MDLQRRVNNMRRYVDSLLEDTIRKIPINYSLKSATSTERDSQNDNEFNLVSHFESLLVELQTLLVWDVPANSAFALTFFTIFYWVLAWLRPSFLTCAAMIAFCYHFYEMWIRYVWPAIRVPELATHNQDSWTKMNVNALSAPEIEFCISRIRLAFFGAFQRLKSFRAESHGKFCGLSAFVFALIYFVSKNIPGFLLAYGIAIMIFLTPGILLHLLPKEYLETMLNYCLIDIQESSNTFSSDSSSDSLNLSNISSTKSAENMLKSSSIMSCLNKNTEQSYCKFKTLSHAQSSLLKSSEDKETDDQTEPVNQALETAFATCLEVEKRSIDHCATSVECVPAVHTSLENAPQVDCSLSSPELLCETVHLTTHVDSSSNLVDDRCFNDSSMTVKNSNQSPVISSSSSSLSLDAPFIDGHHVDEDCLVKSNYCENFFILDRQQQQEKEIKSSNHFEAIETEKEDGDDFGDDYEIISDSEVELLTSKRHF